MSPMLNYDDFKLEINRVEESLFGKSNASKATKELRVACMVISSIFTSELENDVHEMIPHWRDEIRRAMRTIERTRSLDSSLNKRAKTCYLRAKILLDIMPVLRFKKFSVSEALKSL